MPALLIQKHGQRYKILVGQRSQIDFEQRHGKDSLKELCRLLIQDRYRFSEIGRRYRVSRERIRQIYNKLFAPVLLITGTQRWRIWQDSKIRPARECPLRRLPDHLMAIKRAAKRQGITVEAVRCIGSDGLPVASRRRLILNGKRVVVKLLKHRDTNSLVHVVTSLSTIKEVDFLIVLVSPRGLKQHCFIIPSQVLIQSGYCRYQVKDSEVLCFYLPAIRSPSKGPGKRRKVNWWQYENAWRLLKKPPHHRS